MLLLLCSDGSNLANLDDQGSLTVIHPSSGSTVNHPSRVASGSTVYHPSSASSDIGWRHWFRWLRVVASPLNVSIVEAPMGLDCKCATGPHPSSWGWERTRGSILAVGSTMPFSMESPKPPAPRGLHECCPNFDLTLSLCFCSCVALCPRRQTCCLLRRTSWKEEDATEAQPA